MISKFSNFEFTKVSASNKDGISFSIIKQMEKLWDDGLFNKVAALWLKTDFEHEYIEPDYIYSGYSRLVLDQDMETVNFIQIAIKVVKHNRAQDAEVNQESPPLPGFDLCFESELNCASLKIISSQSWEIPDFGLINLFRLNCIQYSHLTAMLGDDYLSIDDKVFDLHSCILSRNQIIPINNLFILTDDGWFPITMIKYRGRKCEFYSIWQQNDYEEGNLEDVLHVDIINVDFLIPIMYYNSRKKFKQLYDVLFDLEIDKIKS